MTSSENVTSCFCNHFSNFQSHYACKMCPNYPGIQLEPVLHEGPVVQSLINLIQDQRKLLFHIFNFLVKVSFCYFCFSRNKRYGYHQRENTGSRLFTEVKPCWTGLISGWVTISIKYPVLYSLRSQAGVVDINHAFHLYYNVVCGSSFSRSPPDFEGFLRALRFPPSAKLTPTLIQYAGPH